MSEELDDIELVIEYEEDLHIPTKEEVVRNALESIEEKVEQAKKLLNEAGQLASKNNLPLTFSLNDSVGYEWDSYSKTWDYWMSSSLQC